MTAGASGHGGPVGPAAPDALRRPGARATRRRPARRAALEPFLVLVAAPPLLLGERFGWPAEALALAWLAGLWVARRRSTGRWTVPTVLDAPALALLATLPGAILAARAAVPDVGLAAAVSRAESLVFAVALGYAVANAVSTPARAWGAAAALLAAGAGLAGLALASVDWPAALPVLGPLAARLPRFVDSVPHATLAAYGVAGAVRVHPNSAAALVALLVPLALTCLAWPPRDGHAPAEVVPRRWARAAAIAALVVGLAVLALSASRGAGLGLAAALVLLGGMRWRWLRGLAAGAALTALVLVAAAGPAAVAARLAANGPAGGAAVDSRLALWRDGLALVAAHPATGIGLNTFVVAHGRRPEYAGGFVYQGAPHVHNTLLQAALDYGLPGFVAAVGLYVALAWAAWRAHRRLAGTPVDAVVVGLAAGLLAHAVHGLVDAVALGSKAGGLPWALAGALAGARARAHRWRPDAGDDHRHQNGE